LRTGNCLASGPVASSLPTRRPGEKGGRRGPAEESCADRPGRAGESSICSARDRSADRALLMSSLTLPGAVVESDRPLTCDRSPRPTAGGRRRARDHPSTQRRERSAGLPPLTGDVPRSGLGEALARCSLEPARMLRRGAAEARKGPNAAGPERHRVLGNGRDQPTRQLPAQHARVGWDQACPGATETSWWRDRRQRRPTRGRGRRSAPNHAERTSRDRRSGRRRDSLERQLSCKTKSSAMIEVVFNS